MWWDFQSYRPSSGELGVQECKAATGFQANLRCTPVFGTIPTQHNITPRSRFTFSLIPQNRRHEFHTKLYYLDVRLLELNLFILHFIPTEIMGRFMRVGSPRMEILRRTWLAESPRQFTALQAFVLDHCPPLLPSSRHHSQTNPI